MHLSNVNKIQVNLPFRAASVKTPAFLPNLFSGACEIGRRKAWRRASAPPDPRFIHSMGSR